MQIPLITTKALPILAAVGAVALTISSPVPTDVHVGIDNGRPPVDDRPYGPAFTFTLLCYQWRLEYVVDGGGLSLWTQCPK